MPKRKRTARTKPEIEATLPPEILEQIFLKLEFKDLLQARLTCPRWRDTITSCPELRDRFLVRFPHDRKIAKITRNYRPIAALKASNVEFKLKDYSKIGSIKAWWPAVASTVTGLTLRGCEFPGHMLRYVVNLRSLELDCAKIGGMKKVDFKLSILRKLVINSSSPGLLSGMISKLEVLEYRTKVEDQGELRSMVELIMSVRATLEELIVDVPASYLQEFSLLADLRLKKVYINAYWTRLTYGIEMVSFVQAIRSIEDLTIVDSLYDESLHAALLSQPGLKRLELKFVAPIVEYDDDPELNVLPLIPNVLPNLESLRINCVDDSGSPKLRFQQGCRFPKLKDLYIFSAFIKGESLRKILLYSPNLYSLYLYCDFQSWNQLIRLITQPKSLRSLTFGSIGPFNMIDVESISTKPCKTLQYLRIEPNMSDVEDFKNAQIIPLLRIFPRLTELHIEYGVNDELVKGICRNLTRLERLSMRNDCTTHRAILYIRHYGRKLKYLRLYGFWQLEVEDMYYFVQNLDHFGHARHDFVGELRSIILDCIKFNEPMSESDSEFY